jgi:hypothetical protein
MGSFAGDDGYEGADTTDADDSAMAGVVYDRAARGESMTEEERRRLSLPSIQGPHVAAQAPSEGYGPHSQTYPPAGQRSVVKGGLYPPNVDRGDTSSSTAPSIPAGAASGQTTNTSISSIAAGGSSSLYSQSAMTESPKPLSPGGQANQSAQEAAALARKRASLSGTQPPQHGLLGHRPADQHPATGLSLPPPAAPGSRGSRSTGGASHARGGSDNANNLFASDEGHWAYTQALDDKVKQLVERITTLESHIVTLERTKTAQEQQISFLTTEVTTLRQQAEARSEAPPTAHA